MDPRLRGSGGAEVAGMTKGSETPGAPFPGRPPAWIDRAAPCARPVPQREIALGHRRRIVCRRNGRG